MYLSDLTRELRELGARGTLFRIGWEARVRTGLAAWTLPKAPRIRADLRPSVLDSWPRHLPFADPVGVREAMKGLIPEPNRRELQRIADEAVKGNILGFGNQLLRMGMPIAWHRDPITGHEWNSHSPWTKALAGRERESDVKMVWEPARFPQAYYLARAATLFPDRGETYAVALAAQIDHFISTNPSAYGVHWASGQEIAFRVLAWLFAAGVLLFRRPSQERWLTGKLLDAMLDAGAYIEQNVPYARIAVYNNHLISEGLALFVIGSFVPEVPECRRWRALGRRILDEEAERQFYKDGAYIQQSHNYHRVALINYHWACAFARAMEDSPSSSWLKAMERSLDFLLAHQNPSDGRLPNYGANDGALPALLSTCRFPDMRPILQATSVMLREERVYESGPWDELTCWFYGPMAIHAPLRAVQRKSVSFRETGYHVLRGTDPSSFAAFRCGSLRDRFSQIDMLHLDVWWRGQNVLVDPGSYLYNGPERWHNHFMRTESHNTVMIDGLDQMVHFRQFKVLYWTEAKLRRFEDHPAWALVDGEQYGYRRPANVVHRRSVLFVKDDLWVVVDRLRGGGAHQARLHWLGGPYPFVAAADGMTLTTPEGNFVVSVRDSDGAISGERDVLAGDERGPRGWLSRHYAEKVAAPSLAVRQDFVDSLVLVSVLGSEARIAVEGSSWSVRTATADVAFDLTDGVIDNARVEQVPV